MGTLILVIIVIALCVVGYRYHQTHSKAQAVAAVRADVAAVTTSVAADAAEVAAAATKAAAKAANNPPAA
jgi:predicted negative regulator of RcsB-dependent stress response